MPTNFFSIEICSAAHDAQQLNAMRTAQLPCFLRRCSDFSDLRNLLARFFRQQPISRLNTAAANA